jgi:hypothetical protein
MTNEDSWITQELCVRHSFEYRRPLVRSNHGVKSHKTELLIGRDVRNIELIGYKALRGEAEAAEDHEEDAA